MGEKLREAPTPTLPRPGCGRETLTTSGVCGEEMRPPQERAANENRLEFRDPRRNTGKGYSCVHGKVIIISAEVKHSGGSAFHLFRLGACEGGGAGGSSGGPGGSRFPRGVGDAEGLSEAARAGSLRSSPASARSFSRAQDAILSRAGSLWGCQGLRFTSASPRGGGGGGQMEGRREERPWPLKRKTGHVELREICREARASGFWTVLPPLRMY